MNFDAVHNARSNLQARVTAAGRAISRAPVSLRRAPEHLRALVRTSEVWLTALAAVAGTLAGVLVCGMSYIVTVLHRLIFHANSHTGVSGATNVPPLATMIAPAVGGAVLGAVLYAYSRWRGRIPVDPIEANALHGGRLSLTDSFIVAIQNVISNGFGASVGLEAGYTQIGSGIASRLGQFFGLRRNDLRTLVGCGAAGAIAAAFDAPLAASAYAFELIIGLYTIATLAPVAVAAFMGTLVAHVLWQPAFVVAIAVPTVDLSHYPLMLLLGVICAGAGILIMRLVTLVEISLRQAWIPAWLRPTIGGLFLGLLAQITIQVLSAGHGALQLAIRTDQTLSFLALVVVLKSLASAVSIGAGFRGGLFFASLFLGIILGKLYGGLLVLGGITAPEAIPLFAVAAMSGLAAAIIGAPLTMIVLALEVTGDFGMAGVVMLCVLAASLTARETFGYSFATWRFHLRGESIRSAHDVGWIRSLTVDSLMRRDLPIVRNNMNFEAFREKFPLGSAKTVIAADEAGRYAGLVEVATVHSHELDMLGSAGLIEDLAYQRDDMLLPSMNAKDAARQFDRLETDSIAVVDTRDTRRTVGLLTEAHLLRRYSAELDRHRREALGEF
ncbi:chloride channel protein, CIC family [Rhizobiales bacterium GAS191]|jgi:CIC family chloride channel protein|nr:chloride channel protein, CIC family [Rhizobiales bacterium GAS113]SEC42022.1 chloride channel protein, CIC family [Rhizobiales bacterium GAS191]